MNEILIVSGRNLNLWCFNKAGRVVGRCRSSVARPVLKWVFDEKPLPVHENGVVAK